MTPKNFQDLERYYEILVHVPAIPFSTWIKLFCASRTTAGESLNVSKATIDNWCHREWIVVDNKLYAPHRDLNQFTDKKVKGVMTLWPQTIQPEEYRGIDDPPVKKPRGRPKGRRNSIQKISNLDARLTELEVAKRKEDKLKDGSPSA